MQYAPPTGIVAARVCLRLYAAGFRRDRPILVDFRFQEYIDRMMKHTITKVESTTAV